MRVHSLGHVVLKVKDLQRSEAFYAGVLDIPVVSRISDPVHMTFFTLGSHHDFAIIEVGEDAPSPDPRATGLAHVAFKVGDSRDDFDSMRSHLDSAGIGILYTAERGFTTSLHLHDPDGHEVELYVDNADNQTTTIPTKGGAGPMPDIASIHHVSLTVTDIDRSVAWYKNVLGLAELMREDHPDGSGYAIIVGKPDFSMCVGLHTHSANAAEPCNETRTGLDHVSFAVPSRAELDTWAEHFKSLDVSQSPVTDQGAYAVLVFRDPDNIQLELFSAAPHR